MGDHQKVIVDSSSSFLIILKTLLYEPFTDVKVDSFVSEENTQLINGVETKNLDQVTNAIGEKGANVNFIGEDGESILMKAASNNNTSEMLRYLIDSGAEVKQKDNQGRTAIHYAAGSGNINGIQLLKDNLPLE